MSKNKKQYLCCTGRVAGHFGVDTENINAPVRQCLAAPLARLTPQDRRVFTAVVASEPEEVRRPELNISATKAHAYRALAMSKAQAA